MMISPPNTVARRTVFLGILCALGGSAVFSINDVAIKSLSTGYALHQVVLIRAIIGVCFLSGFVTVTGMGFRHMRTRRPLAHLLRVSFVVLSNVLYFLGLAALPLADAVAIGFVSQLFVTLLSALVLGEKVGPHRILAVVVGFLGVLVMMRPGSGAIQPGAILVLISALCYASSNLMTRRMKDSESAVTLGFYVQMAFIIVSAMMGLTVGGGQYAGSSDASLAFLFREWVWPPMADWPAFLATGLAVSIGGLMVTQAYRMLEAALVAPFEYASMPMAIFWGVVVFHQWPDAIAWIGIALICGAGLYTFWRETRRKRENVGDT